MLMGFKSKLKPFGPAHLDRNHYQIRFYKKIYDACQVCIILKNMEIFINIYEISPNSSFSD